MRLQRSDSDLGISPQAIWDVVDWGRASLPSMEAIDLAWEVTDREVFSVWEEEWFRLVPGARVLEVVWQRYGCRYKTRDSERIARAMDTQSESWAPELKALAEFVERILSGR